MSPRFAIINLLRKQRSQHKRPRSQLKRRRSQLKRPRSQLKKPRSQLPRPRSQLKRPRSQLEGPRSQLDMFRSQLGKGSGHNWGGRSQRLHQSGLALPRSRAPCPPITDVELSTCVQPSQPRRAHEVPSVALCRVLHPILLAQAAHLSLPLLSHSHGNARHLRASQIYKKTLVSSGGQACLGEEGCIRLIIRRIRRPSREERARRLE